MISFNKFELKNGLRVLHHEDKDSTLGVVNVLYNVGARDENPSQTGFAHLFEHLMFGGSIHIPHYDKIAESAGATNNAYTTNDLTNYYVSLPIENIETAMWLESDRMLSLAFSQKSLDVQKGVVIEEFKQRCFNAPFGQLWHHLRSLLYKESPYRWPTIGLSLSHIEEAQLNDVESFFYKFYHPNNAILCVGGNISLDETKALCEKWFGSIERSGERNQNIYKEEPVQTEARHLAETDLSPNNAVFLAWKGPAQNQLGSEEMEAFAEMLGGTETSPLHIELVKKSGKFNAAECFYSKGLAEGMFVLYGILNDGVTHEEGKSQLIETLEKFYVSQEVSDRLIRVKNRYKTQLGFEYASLLNKAQKLCFYENIGGAHLANEEIERYAALSAEKVIKQAAATLKEEMMSVLYYSPK